MLWLHLRVSIAIKKHHDYNNSYKRQHLIEAGLQFSSITEVELFIVMARSMGDAGRRAA